MRTPSDAAPATSTPAAAWARAATFALAVAALASGAGPARAGAPLPDLTTSVADVEVERDANVTPGDVAEGCASATTGVDLLRFSTFSHNEGAADLLLGDPMCPNCATMPGASCGNPAFHCSPAGGHGHGHYTNYATYELLDAEQNVVAVGGKLGFCLLDTFCEGGAVPRFDSCDFQGLSAGCTDEYAYTLGCQYIEVTGLPDGAYTLRVTVDPLDEIAESDESNNAALEPVSLGPHVEPDVALAGTTVRLAALPSGATRLRLAAEAGGPLDLPSAGLAPTQGGATLAVADAGAPGSGLAFDLPADGWEALGRPPGADGWRFRGGKDGPCRRARLGPRGLRARCEGPGLALPAEGVLDVVFTSGGEKRYCVRFGGKERRNDARRLERVKAAIAACPS